MRSKVRSFLGCATIIHTYSPPVSAEQADNKGDDLDRDAADAPGEIAPDV